MRDYPGTTTFRPYFKTGSVISILPHPPPFLSNLFLKKKKAFIFANSIASALGFMARRHVES